MLYSERKTFLAKLSIEERRERCLEMFEEHLKTRDEAKQIAELQALGEGITAEKLPVYFEDYNILDKKENKYFYELSKEVSHRKQEVKASLKYLSPKDQEIVKGFINEKRQREEWIVEQEEQPVIEPEMQELIEQWRDEKYEWMKKL